MIKLFNFKNHKNFDLKKINSRNTHLAMRIKNVYDMMHSK